MEIILIATALIVGLICGYRLAYIVHSLRVQTAYAMFVNAYNRAWQKWRKKLPTCSICPEVATMYCRGQGGPTTYFCQVHFLRFHQPNPAAGKNMWTCEHPAPVATTRK